MQRSKVLAVVAALIAASVATVVFAGGASAASWHVYKGDMFAGHAYGLHVPAGAESVEFTFEGAEQGKAAIGVYASGGAKVGYYALSSDLTAASIANPSAGQYVVYVYEVAEGALSVRVAAEEEPALDLAPVDLVREDTKIGAFEQGRLDQLITAELKTQPVFLTLLYEGSATDLDATVSSASGTIVTISDESATAFSPGVWTTMKGERLFDAAALEGTTFTVEAHAEQFEGTMVLTTLALDLATPPKPPVPNVTRPATPVAPAAAPPVSGPSVFALAEQAPVAFMAPAGTLTLADPMSAECDPRAEEYDRDCDDVHATIVLYAPDDTVLALVVLDHDAPVAHVQLPVAGEYVAYARHAPHEVVLAKIAGTDTPPQLRVLATEEEVVELDATSFLGARGEAEFELAHVPLALSLSFEDGMGALSDARVENENGVVAATHGIVVLGGFRPTQWTHEDVENFAAGTHTLHVGGLYEGSITLASVHYLRDQVVEPEVADEHEAHEEHDDGEEHPAPSAPLAAPIEGLAPLIERLLPF